MWSGMFLLYFLLNKCSLVDHKGLILKQTLKNLTDPKLLNSSVKHKYGRKDYCNF